MPKHVAVLMGGWSAEREISLRSGQACAEALKRVGYRVTAIDAGRDVASALTAAAPDVALNVLHGRPGEDGTLQGVLEILGIPYSHSGVLASALAMHKVYAKSVFRAAGIPVAQDLVASRFEAARAAPDEPALRHQTHRRGIERRGFHCHRAASAPAAGAYRDDWQFGEQVLIERYIPGKELTCAVIGDRALDVIDIVPATRFYDYEAKYASGGSKHLLPAQILPNVYQEVRNSPWLPIARLAVAV